MISVLLLGIFIGMKHALESDHVAAVASLATRATSTREMVGLGVAWGCGHTVILLAIGAAVLAFDAVVPEQVAGGLELAVGVMLVVLGGDVIRRLIRDRVHIYAHRHGEITHIHAHAHAEGLQGTSGHDHGHPALAWRALLVGAVHGMAGSAALLLLTAQAIHSFWMGVLYIFLFGVGSVAGMAALSAAISLPLRLTARRLGWAYRGLTAIVGIFTIALGIHVVIGTGIEPGSLM